MCNLCGFYYAGGNQTLLTADCWQLISTQLAAPSGRELGGGTLLTELWLQARQVQHLQHAHKHADSIGDLVWGRIAPTSGGPGRL